MIDKDLSITPEAFVQCNKILKKSIQTNPLYSNDMDKGEGSIDAILNTINDKILMAESGVTPEEAKAKKMINDMLENLDIGPNSTAEQIDKAFEQMEEDLKNKLLNGEITKEEYDAAMKELALKKMSKSKNAEQLEKAFDSAVDLLKEKLKNGEITQDEFDKEMVKLLKEKMKNSKNPEQLEEA